MCDSHFIDNARNYQSIMKLEAPAVLCAVKSNPLLAGGADEAWPDLHFNDSQL